MDQLNDERQGLFSYLYDSFPLIVLLSKLRSFQSTQLKIFLHIRMSFIHTHAHVDVCTAGAAELGKEVRAIR